MCVYSMVTDYGRERIPDDKWNPEKWDKWKGFLDKVKEIDDILEQPDCKDPHKEEWMKNMEERMKKMEEELAKARERERKLKKMVPDLVPYEELPEHLRKAIDKVYEERESKKNG